MKNKGLLISLKLGVIFALVFLTSQSSFLFQNNTADIYNASIRLGQNEFGRYAFSLDDNAGFFAKNSTPYYRENDPLLFRSVAALSQGTEYTLLESWPLVFENQPPLESVCYQRVHAWYGGLSGFEDDLKVGLSTDLFSALFPNCDFRKFGEFSFPLSRSGTELTAKIAFLYDANLFNAKIDEGKLYKAVFGSNLLFANKKVVESFGHSQINIVYSQSNYKSQFAHQLFESYSHSDIRVYDCFAETNYRIQRNLEFNQALFPVRIAALLTLIALTALLVWAKLHKQIRLMPFAAFGFAFGGFNALLSLLDRVANLTFFVSPSGLWFSLSVGLIAIFFLLWAEHGVQKYKPSVETYETTI